MGDDPYAAFRSGPSADAVSAAPAPDDDPYANFRSGTGADAAVDGGSPSSDDPYANFRSGSGAEGGAGMANPNLEYVCMTWVCASRGDIPGPFFLSR